MRNQIRDDGSAHARRRLTVRMRDEARKLGVIVVYLWLVFGLLELHEMLLRRELGLTYEVEGVALINALVLGKVMLTAEYFNLGGGLRGGPLIYPIIRKALLLAVIFVVFHILERAIVGLVRGTALTTGVTEVGGGGALDLLAVAAILFVALVPYFGCREITRALGWPTIRMLLFVGSSNKGSDVVRTNAAAVQEPPRE
jgi:hypothetical protein